MARRPLGHGPIAWFLKRFAIGLFAFALLTWLLPRIDGRTLGGVRIAGVAFARTDDPEKALAPLAEQFANEEIKIRTGPHLTRAAHRELGAKLDTKALARRLLELGRSGNPLIDVLTVWDSWLRGRDVTWSPTIDRLALGRYAQAVRRNVERPPIAGATDEQGWSIEGVPGVTLDTVSTAAALETALRTRKTQVEVPLREIAPPTALAIGSPDAVLYDDQEHEDMGAFDEAILAAGNYAAIMAKLRPTSWLPSRGREPMDPPWERFGQGPRRVPAPFGDAARLADSIGLGEIQTVGYLLRTAPKPVWTGAAGRGSGLMNMHWPVPGGRLWRRFGYVRKAEFADKLHRGIDIGAPHGTPIVATNDGIVAFSDNTVRGYGNLLVIVHVDGSVTFSAHCQAIYVFAGQRVQRGRVVGEVGDTGLARGAHVHFEYHVRGVPEDPIDVFEKR